MDGAPVQPAGAAPGGRRAAQLPGEGAPPVNRMGSRRADETGFPHR